MPCIQAIVGPQSRKYPVGAWVKHRWLLISVKKGTTVLIQPPVAKQHFMMVLCKLKAMLALYGNVGDIGHGGPWPSQSSYGLKME